MKFSSAKAVSMGVLLAALAIGVASMLMFEEGTSAYVGSAVMMLIMLAAGLAVMIIWGRCPSCGARLFYGLYKWKICPRCRRSIDMYGRYEPKNKNKNRR